MGSFLAREMEAEGDSLQSLIAWKSAVTDKESKVKGVGDFFPLSVHLKH